MKKFDRIMAAVMSVTGGAYLVYVIWQLWDRHARPEFYAVNSAPWYTSMELIGLIAAGLIALEMVVYMALRRFAERADKQKNAGKTEKKDEEP